MSNDFEIARCLHKMVIPRAVLYFTGEAFDYIVTLKKLRSNSVLTLVYDDQTLIFDLEVYVHRVSAKKLLCYFLTTPGNIGRF